MRTTRAVAKVFGIEVYQSPAPEDTMSQSSNKKSNSRKSGSGGNRYRIKKVVNNPWGNKGRRKCATCRSRKRSCIFKDENQSCQFCAATGAKCGPKVLAEKARYLRVKSEEHPHADCSMELNSQAVDEMEDIISVTVAPVLAESNNHVAPGKESCLRIHIEKPAPEEISMLAPLCLSTPITLPDENALQWELKEEIEANPSYLATPAPEEDLPLYTEQLDEQVLQWSTIEYSVPASSESAYKYICLYA